MLTKGVFINTLVWGWAIENFCRQTFWPPLRKPPKLFEHPLNKCKNLLLERVRTRTRTQWVSPSPSPDSDSGLMDSDSDSDSTSVDSDSSAVDSDSGLMDSDSTQVDSDSQWVQVSPVRNAQDKFKLSSAIMDEIRGRN